MRIGGSREGAFGHGERPPQPKAGAPAASRALTVVTAPTARDTPPLARGDAAFLAQLIATKTQAPQTRARRRAEPEEAIAAYGKVAGLMR